MMVMIIIIIIIFLHNIIFHGVNNNRTATLVQVQTTWNLASLASGK